MTTKNQKTQWLLKDELDKAVICVVGLGVIGLPLAQEFARRSMVIGFDINDNKLKTLSDENHNGNLALTNDSRRIKEADFILLAVPTPLTNTHTPDLTYFKQACQIIGPNLKKGCTVVVESSVYPGATEEIVKPILEGFGLRYGSDFRLACSPERVNPGDDQHALGRVTKIVAGMDEETTDLVASLYLRIVSDVFKAKDIRTAEAAKLMENIQRDVNIALMNEMALIFDVLGMDTMEVIRAAATKWNFAYHVPGLVGGYCIPVSPQYFMYKAREKGVNPRLISAAREVNDFIPLHVINLIINALTNLRGSIADSKVLFMGLTYKENVPDSRCSPIVIVMEELQKKGVQVLTYDPVLTDSNGQFQKVDSLARIKNIDCIVLAVAHDVFRSISLDELKSISSAKPVLIDIRCLFNGQEARDKGFYYKSL